VFSLETKEVLINGKVYTIKEISLDDSLELSTIKDPKESTKRILQLAVIPSISDDDRKNMSMKDGVALIEEINKLNGLTKDFLSSVKTPNTESGN